MNNTSAYHCFPPISFTTPHSSACECTICSCIRHCLVMKTYSFQQQSHMPVGLTLLTTCLDSETHPVQTPGQTHYQSMDLLCELLRYLSLCLTFELVVT